MNWTAAITIGLVVVGSLLMAASGITAMAVGSRIKETDTDRNMQGTMDYLSKRVDELERGRTELLTRLDNMSAYVRTLITIMDAAGIKPPPPPWEDSKIMRVPQVRNVANMAERIARHFNDDELADLASQVDIDIEDVKGDTHKARALSLVQAAERYGSYDDLVKAAATERPRAKWD